MSVPELRIYPFTEVRLRDPKDKNSIGTMEGHVAVFNVWSDVINGFFRERALPGCFAESLSVDDYRSMKNHNPDMLLGRKSSGTLTMREDEVGLHFSVDIPDTTYGRDLVVSAERGDIKECSFMFQTIEDRWGQNTEIMPNGEVRDLIKVRLFEGGPVAFPAYPHTDAVMRAFQTMNIDALGRLMSERHDDSQNHTITITDPGARVDPAAEDAVDRDELLKRRLEIARRI